MKLDIGKKIAGLLIFAIITFGILGTWSYLTINQFINSTKWSVHTRDVLRNNNLLISYLKDAETGQRGYLLTGNANYLEPYDNSRTHIFEILGTLKQLTSDNPIQQQRIIEYNGLITSKFAELQQTIDLRRDKGFDDAIQVVKTDKGKEIMDEFRRIHAEFESHELALLSERETKMFNDANATKNVIIYGSIFASLLLAIIGFMLIKNITGPLKKVTEIASEIADGNLNINIHESNRKDEVGMLHNTFALMVNKLRHSMQELVEGISLLGSSSSEILAATTQVSAGISETATAISQTTTTVEEVRQASQLSNDKASKVAENAKHNANASKIGTDAVDKTISTIHQVQSQIEAIASTIVRLSEQSQQIGGIIASVNDVADQSNLLAVNASIEAAKAGEHGKGFAVVAEEIKNLAHLSKQATTQVRTILIDVQKATNSAVMATEQGSKAVADGVNQSKQAGESINILSKSVIESVQAASQIVASSKQQNVGMDQVSLAITNINQAGAENAASMKQAEKAAQDLAELGNKLKDLVNQYKL